MKPLLLPLLLQAGFFIMLTLEMALPSGGLLAVAAGVLFISSWALALGGEVPGLAAILLVSDVVLIPLCILFGLKWMRRSPLNNVSELSSADGFQAFTSLDSALVGQSGTACTPLRPSGKVQIGSHTYDAISSTDFLDSGTAVVVKAINGNELLVAPPPVESVPL